MTNDDNRIENLCFLCPNCHSQTSTYSGKKKKKEKENITKTKNYKRKDKFCECGNKIHRTSIRCQKCAMNNIRKIERPSYIDLLKDIDDYGYSGAGRKYGVTYNCIKKWLKVYEGLE